MQTSTSNPGTLRFRVFVSSLLVVLLLLGGAGTAAFLSSLREATPLRDPEPRRYNVEVFRVEVASLQERISAFGTAEAEREVVLSAQVSGEVLSIHPRLKVGLAVDSPVVKTGEAGESLREPGDTLLEIDPRLYSERVIQVESRMAEARAELSTLDQEERNMARLATQLEKDTADFTREYAKIEGLAARKIATDSDLRRALIELRAAETQLVQIKNSIDLLPSQREQVVRRVATLQNELEIAKLDRERTQVRPPFAGRIAEVHVERGQYVRPGDPLAKLTDDSLVDVPCSVSLEDYARLASLVQAGKYPLADLAENETAPARWHGQLMRLAPRADEQTRSVMVYVQVDNRRQETPLLPGTFVHARIEAPVLKQVIAVPRDAVLNQRGFVVRDGTAQQREVRIRRTVHGLALMESGFDPGELVILSNLDVLYDGAPVNTSLERTLADELSRQQASLVREIVDGPSAESP